MGYYQAKKLKIDKKNNRVSGALADSNWRDCDDKMIYDEYEDMYSEYNTIGDKIAYLYYDIICGNIHTSISTYADLVCSFDYFKAFTDDFREVLRNDNKKDNDLYNVYLKHKSDFDEYTKKNCILRSKEKYYNSMYAYVKRENQKSLSLTFNKEKAKRFNDKRVQQYDYFMENYEIEYI